MIHLNSIYFKNLYQLLFIYSRYNTFYISFHLDKQADIKLLHQIIGTYQATNNILKKKEKC